MYTQESEKVEITTRLQYHKVVQWMSKGYPAACFPYLELFLTTSIRKLPKEREIIETEDWDTCESYGSSHDFEENLQEPLLIDRGRTTVSNRVEKWLDSSIGKEYNNVWDVATRPPPTDEEIGLGTKLLRLFEGEISIGGACINKRSLSTLCDHQWLDDEVINGYMQLLNWRNHRSHEFYKQTEEGIKAITVALEMANESGLVPDSIYNKLKHPISEPKHVYAFSTFFLTQLVKNGEYDYNAVRRWTTRKDIDVFSYDILLFPVHSDGVHWALGVVYVTDRVITYLDSMGDPGYRFKNIITSWLQDEYKDKVKGDEILNWDFHPCVQSDTDEFPRYHNNEISNTVDNKLVDSDYRFPPVPKQNNSYDCGVFMCQFAESISDGRWEYVTDFSCTIMPKLRKRMIVELVNKSVKSTKINIPD